MKIGFLFTLAILNIVHQTQARNAHLLRVKGDGIDGMVDSVKSSSFSSEPGIPFSRRRLKAEKVTDADCDRLLKHDKDEVETTQLCSESPSFSPTISNAPVVSPTLSPVPSSEPSLSTAPSIVASESPSMEAFEPPSMTPSLIIITTSEPSVAVSSVPATAPVENIFDEDPSPTSSPGGSIERSPFVTGSLLPFDLTVEGSASPDQITDSLEEFFEANLDYASLTAVVLRTNNRRLQQSSSTDRTLSYVGDAVFTREDLPVDLHDRQRLLLLQLVGTEFEDFDVTSATTERSGVGSHTDRALVAGGALVGGSILLAALGILIACRLRRTRDTRLLEADALSTDGAVQAKSEKDVMVHQRIDPLRLDTVSKEDESIPSQINVPLKAEIS